MIGAFGALVLAMTERPIGSRECRSAWAESLATSGGLSFRRRWRARLPPADAIIRSKIESGEYPPGAPLPSAKSMSQEYGISVGAVTAL